MGGDHLVLMPAHTHRWCWLNSAFSTELIHRKQTVVHHSISLHKTQSVAWNSNVTCLPVSLLYIPVKMSSCRERRGGDGRGREGGEESNVTA